MRHLLSMENLPHNQPDAPDPARASQLQVESHRRGVGEPRGLATQHDC